MPKRFRDRQLSTETSIPNTHPKFKHTPADVALPGGPRAGANVYPRMHNDHDSARARTGADWAAQTSPTGDFHGTNGLHPDVHGHVVPFQRSVNMSGGVYQPTPLAGPAPDVARASISDRNPVYHISGQGSGNTRRKQLAKIRGRVTRKIARD